jgi:hypothetical protein
VKYSFLTPNSSNIVEVAHDGLQTLTVTYKDGRIYQFTPCPFKEFEAFHLLYEEGHSIGKALKLTLAILGVRGTKIEV